MLPIPEPKKANEPGVVLSVKNSGETPAYDVISWMEITVIPPSNENTPRVPPLQHLFPHSLGPGCLSTKALWFGRPLTPNEISLITVGQRAIFIHGRIEYRDAFKKRRFTNFRLFYSNRPFPPPQGVTLSYSLAGNDAS
jgi:hypothetical protein